jgi:hypothetical protein
LKANGHRVVLVTSAAVGTGLRQLNMAENPSKLTERHVKKKKEPLGFESMTKRVHI